MVLPNPIGLSGLLQQNGKQDLRELPPAPPRQPPAPPGHVLGEGELHEHAVDRREGRRVDAGNVQMREHQLPATNFMRKKMLCLFRRKENDNNKLLISL